MRVASQTVYMLTQSRLNNLVGDLNKTNTQVTTGKRINTLSDDPVGLTRVMDLKSSLSGIDQLDRNISTGKAWLDSAEISLSSVQDLLTETKTLALAMNTDTVNAGDRAGAAEQVENILKQITELANTQVDGNYIFAGTRNQTQPFEFDDPQNPKMVLYSGNDDPFAIKTGKDSRFTVGHDGEAVFGNAYVTVDETNNMIDFKEQTGATDTVLTATIPDGTYTASELAAVLEKAMTEVSSTDGNKIDYTIKYDAIDKQFTIEDDSASGGLYQLLWKTGEHADTSIGSDLGFETAHDSDVNANAGCSGEKGVQWGIFKTLFDLKDALATNNEDGINRSLTRLDADFEHINDEISAVGYKGASLDTKENIIGNLETNYLENKSNIEDTDMISAISDLQLTETAYQAALTSSSKVMQLSLVDYL